LFLSGEAGIGKTYSVLKTFEKHYTYNVIEEEKPEVTVYKGFITKREVFNALRRSSQANKILVFDDCDSVFQDTDSMNFIKAATDPDGNREVTYASSATGGDERFRFDGGIIIISNVKIFNNPHFKALTDRMHVYEMDVTNEEKLAKIYDVAVNSPDKIDRKIGFEIMYWLHSRTEDVRYLSLRTFIKIYQLAVGSARNWQRLAEITVLKQAREEALTKKK